MHIPEDRHQRLELGGKGLLQELIRLQNQEGSPFRQIGEGVPQGVPGAAKIVRKGRCGAPLFQETGLLEEWCTATPFPDYFGGTWDALRDALSDLPEGGTFLVLEADQLLQEALPTEFQTLVAVLRDVQEDLDPKPFRLVLQVAPDRYETLVEGLRGLGLL